MEELSEEITLAVKLIEELNTLSTDDIHDKFVALGIKGIRMDSRSCAISEYIKGQTGFEKISTSPSDIMFLYDDHGKEIYKEVYLSRNVNKFVHCFDHGEYPELEKGWTHNNGTN